MPTTMDALSGVDCSSYMNNYDMFLGQTAQPEVLVNVRQDPTVANQALMMSSMAGTAGPASYNMVGHADSAGGYSTRDMAPLYVPDPIDAQIQTAASLLPDDLLKTAISSVTFGQGTFSTFKSDKPPQGYDMLRPVIPIPIAGDFTNAGFIPSIGPFNNTTFNTFNNGYDPRYSAPVYDTASGTYKYPVVPVNTHPAGGASGGAPAVSTMLNN
ncbi:hypothetical protein WJX74_006567 [Apatococcus lobatus]|uniref:Uncharacterized protein n=1 Tax=Apatococcus lobatus TaxID=904363 RepID=A0AAW1R008_9CHLO